MSPIWMVIGDHPFGGGQEEGGGGGKGEGVTEGVGKGVSEITNVTMEVAACVEEVSEGCTSEAVGVFVMERVGADATYISPSTRESVRLPKTNKIETSAASTPKTPWRASADFTEHLPQVASDPHWIKAAAH